VQAFGPEEVVIHLPKQVAFLPLVERRGSGGRKLVGGAFPQGVAFLRARRRFGGEDHLVGDQFLEARVVDKLHGTGKLGFFRVGDVWCRGGVENDSPGGFASL
jgi:hypothetical protein